MSVLVMVTVLLRRQRRVQTALCAATGRDTGRNHDKLVRAQPAKSRSNTLLAARSVLKDT